MQRMTKGDNAIAWVGIVAGVAFIFHALARINGLY